VLDSIALSRTGAAALSGANPWAAQPLIVTSVDYVKRPEAMRSLETLVWDLVVVDEAHGLSGRSDRNAALTLLGERARTLVMLTATPHSGDEAAFARMCGVGDLDHAFPLLVFRRTRKDAGLPSARTTRWLNVTTSAAESALHLALTTYTRLVWREKGDRSGAARLAMIVLMRRACSSAASLARSVERRMALLSADSDADPATEQQLELPLAMAASDDEEPGTELGAPGLADSKDERRCLEEILQLARDAEREERKLQALGRLLRRTREPAIVFTEYRDTLVPLAAALTGFTTACLHGGLSAAERRHVLERFRSGAVQVLLATDAASEGLNLQQRCRLVINLELPWTPTRLEQRVGRVDRIGQRRRVHALNLVAAGTSEESTVARLVRRMERVHDVFGAMQAGITTEQDIARCVIGQEEAAAPDDSGGVPLPAGLIVTNLRDAAVLEAERTSMARTLALGGSEATRLQRPFVAPARSTTRREYWAFRLEFTDADDEILWETLIGLSFDAASCASRRSDDIRRHADRSRASLAPAVRRAEDALRADVITALRTPVALASLREEAILAVADARHGRLAAALVQRGLFDRRAERAAATQDAALHEMLSRCRERLSKLARLRFSPAAAAGPAFGLVRR
jgi:superfamily II DNA or RNA helicase